MEVMNLCLHQHVSPITGSTLPKNNIPKQQLSQIDRNCGAHAVQLSKGSFREDASSRCDIFFRRAAAEMVGRLMEEGEACDPETEDDEVPPALFEVEDYQLLVLHDRCAELQTAYRESNVVEVGGDQR